MATYPGAIKTFTSLTDGIDNVLASHQNEPNDEITAIETAVGVNPTTIDDTVAPAAPSSVANFMDMLANIVKTQSGSTTWTNAAAAAIMKSIGTTKGDLIAFSASATPVRFAGSTTDGDVLTRGSTETAGVKWASIFNNAEGDPAAIGTAADGTSNYAARRDHVHATTNGGATLGSGFDLSGGSSGVFQDTGLSVTLPSAGVYLINGTIKGILGGSVAGAYITAKLYNSTDAADVANSETLVVYTTATGVNFQNSCGLCMTPITVAASKVIKLYAAFTGGGTLSAASIGSDSAGRTRLSYVKIG